MGWIWLGVLDVVNELISPIPPSRPKVYIWVNNEINENVEDKIQDFILSVSDQNSFLSFIKNY